MTKEEIDFVKIMKGNKEDALRSISDFFAGFKIQSARKPLQVRDDDYYSSVHRLSRLIDSKGKPTTLYIYDKELYCRGCGYNCNRDNNRLELRDMRNEEDVKKLFDVSVEISHELTRNFLVGLGIGPKLLEIRTWYEDYPKHSTTAKLSASDGYYFHELEPDFDKTLELIRSLRK